MSKETINVVLVREEDQVHKPVYYINERLIDAEIRYTEMENLTSCLIVASRKLRTYLHTHVVEVYTNYPPREILQKPDTLGRLLKWSVELGQFKIDYKPQNAIKGHVPVDFIVEFSYLAASPYVTQIEIEGKCMTPHWDLYVDGSSNVEKVGAGISLISPEGRRIGFALRFGLSLQTTMPSMKH